MIFLPANFRSILFISIIPLLLGLYLLSVQFGDRNSFLQTKGRIVYLSDRIDKISDTLSGKHRFLALDSYPYVFNLFIGKDFGDFSPKYENIDKLHLGDWVTVYYEHEPRYSDNKINYSAQYIDNASINFFERGGKAAYIGCFSIFTALLLVVIGYYLKRKGKIE
jgi:hypothetical protein